MIGAAARKRRNRLKAEIQRLVEASIDANADPRERGSLLADMDDRLDDPGFEAELGRVPVGEVVVRLCNDLGVRPKLRDWSDEMLLDVIGDELTLPAGWQDVGPADADGGKIVVDPSGRRFVLDRTPSAVVRGRASRPSWSLRAVSEPDPRDSFPSSDS